MKCLLRLAALLAAAAAAAAVLCRLLNEKGRGSYVTLFEDLPGGVRQKLKFRTPMEEKHKHRIGNNHNNCHHIDEVHNGYITQNRIFNCAAN